MDSDTVEEKAVPGEALGDHSDADTEPGDSHKDGDRVEAFPNTETEQPVLNVKPAEDGHDGAPEANVVGGQPTEAEVRELVARLARVSPGPHHHAGGWIVGLCPSCGERTVAWRFKPLEAVVVCGCPGMPSWARAPELPVQLLVLR
jgi:hypothetical protein